MGSFNVGCGISNLSIGEGEPTGFLFLTRSLDVLHTENYNKRLCLPNHGRVLYNYSTDLFTPYLPPVYGVYNDYGNITDIEPNITTQILEEWFRMPVKDLIEVIFAPHSDIYTREYTLRKYYGEQLNNISDNNSYDPTVILTGIGFEEIAPNEFKHDASDLKIFIKNKTQYSSVTMIGVSPEKATGPYLDIGQALSAYTNMTGKYIGFKEDTWGLIKEISTLSGMFFHRDIYDHMSEGIASDIYLRRAIEEFKHEWKKTVSNFDKDSLTDITELNRLRDNNISFGLEQDNVHLLEAYKGELGVNELISVVNLRAIMSSVNRMFQPSYNGVQYGDPEAARFLANLINDHLNKNEENRL
jgi:hypothetical protein